MAFMDQEQESFSPAFLFTGLWGKMSVAKASGTMKVTNLSSNVAALVVFLLSGKIVIMLGIAASVFSIAGHYTGAGMVMKNGSRIIRPIILIVLALRFYKDHIRNIEKKNIKKPVKITLSCQRKQIFTGFSSVLFFIRYLQ